jgi:hypothetical protein
MDSLKDLREWFLADPEVNAPVFKIADYYLVKYDENAEAFLIPHDHAFVKPVVEAFAGESMAYAKWLRKLTGNYLVKGSPPAVIIGEVAKAAQCRGINRRKRYLEGEAIRQAVIKGMIQDKPVDKQRYKRRVSEVIKREYKALLDGVRAKTKGGRISVEERDEIVTAFWDELLQRYTSGDVPEA